MKKNLHLLFFLLLLSLNLQSIKTIKIATGEWPPYTSAKQENLGFLNEIIKKSFELENINVEFEFLPWNRAKSLAKSGEMLACSVWAKSPEIEKDFYFSDTLYEGPLVFFHLKEKDFKWDSYQDLTKYRIGLTLGNTYGVKFQELHKSGKLKVFPNYSELQNFKVLLERKIDAFPINRDAGLKIIKENFPKEDFKKFTYNKNAIRISNYTLIFSKSEEGKKMKDVFNKGLKKLKQKGLYQVIINNSEIIKIQSSD